MSSPASVLRPGETCWAVERARRVAFLVDAGPYFGVLADAMARARRSIVLVGWDFNSRIRLKRGDDALVDGHVPEHRFELAAYLRHLLRERPTLRVYVLGWDFPVLYAAEREMLPLVRFQMHAGPRLRFRLDDRHPLGASQHQKIALIDEELAFVGGIDLSVCRWDTPEHRADDERRSDEGFEGYAPFHDAQMAVEGPAARRIAELVRERWKRATGRRLPRVRDAASPWPERLVADLEDVDVGIARTLPAFEGRDEVREVEALYARSIEEARELVYLENQYLTSDAVRGMLARSLERPEGPEVVIVVPRGCSGWLEQQTMGVLRSHVVRDLREADRHGRLTIVYPEVDGLPAGQVLNVHAKIAVIDDALARIGSANLSNRSMGLDSECDLAVEARGDERVARAIRGLRLRLLAEHLGCTPEEVRSAVERRGSVGGAIDDLGGGARRLVRLEAREEEQAAPELLGGLSFVDPERPVDLDELTEAFVPDELVRRDERARGRRAAAVFALLVAIAALWRFTPLADVVGPGAIAAALAPLDHELLGPLGMLVLFVLGGLALLPVTVMIVASALVFPPSTAFAVSIAGGLASAALGYGIGRLLWRDTVRRLAGRRLDRLNRELAARGVAAVAAVRLVPLAPFTVVNVVAGASHIAFRDYLLGTAIALVPGVAVATLLSSRVLGLFADPGLRSFGLVAGAVVIAWAGWLATRRALLRIAARRTRGAT